MEHTKTYQEFKKNDNTKFVRYSEGAEMYHILKDTKGSGVGSDYAMKLENILREGRTVGFKFIFSSQTCGIIYDQYGYNIKLNHLMHKIAKKITKTLAKIQKWYYYGSASIIL